MKKKSRSYFYLSYAAAVGVALLLLVHFLFDPYRVLSNVGSSDQVVEIVAGEAERIIFMLPDVVPGTEYRVKASAQWEGVEKGKEAWRTARLIFAAYNEKGRWIPAPHWVCAADGNGRGTFQEEFTIPQEAAKARLVLQHYGSAGSLRLDSFTVQVVELRSITRWLFSILQVFWFATVAWTALIFRLHRRKCGLGVIIVAGLIAAGMLLPDQVVTTTPGAVADWVATPVVVAPRAPTPATGERRPVVEQDLTAERVDRTPGLSRTLRSAVAARIRTVDMRFWGHAGLFMLLGITSVLAAQGGRPERRSLLVALAGGLCYALAAELLQVTTISRTVRLYDIGINAMGLAAGVLAVAVVRGWRRRRGLQRGAAFIYS